MRFLVLFVFLGCVPFVDSFEADVPWGVFEEVVAGDACAGVSGGGITIETSTALAHTGTRSLHLRANPLLTPALSNHLIAQKRINNEGASRAWSAMTWVYVDTATIGLTQTGPEMSLQNTREGLEGWRTRTAGIQYVGNQWTEQKWWVWAATGPGGEDGSEVAAWTPITGPPLDENGWWSVQLKVDYATNTYIAARLVSPSAGVTTIDLSTVPVAREVKFSETALWVTLEVQNLWDCQPSGGAWDAHAYYDDVVVAPL